MILLRAVLFIAAAVLLAASRWVPTAPFGWACFVLAIGLPDIATAAA